MTSANHQQDKLFEEICLQNQNFDHYEKNFQEVLMELESDDVLDTFRREYENLHNSFLKCHEGEKRLIKKCTDLTSEISSCILKVRSAEELSQGDQSTIDQLKKEIQKAKSKISQSKETEITLKEKIKQLKSEIKELDKQVDRGAAGVVGHDNTINELTRVRSDLAKEHDTQRAQVVALQHEINYLESRVAKVAEEKLQKEQDLRNLHDAIELKGVELEEQRERKDRKERELKQAKEDLGKRNKQINEQHGITVITNLHTLDTARHYCERIIGMAGGRVVFDGAPHALTEDAAREIYGADGLKDAFSEAITSTSLSGVRKATEAASAASAFAAG